MAILAQAVKKRREYLINQLMRYGYFKGQDGRQLYELTLTELENKHIDVKCRFGQHIVRGE